MKVKEIEKVLLEKYTFEKVGDIYIFQSQTQLFPYEIEIKIEENRFILDFISDTKYTCSTCCNLDELTNDKIDEMILEALLSLNKKFIEMEQNK